MLTQEEIEDKITEAVTKGSPEDFGLDVHSSHSTSEYVDAFFTQLFGGEVPKDMIRESVLKIMESNERLKNVKHAGKFDDVFDITVVHAKKAFLADSDLPIQIVLGWNSGVQAIMMLEEYNDDVRETMGELFEGAILESEKGAGRKLGQPDWWVQQTLAWYVDTDLDGIKVPEEGGMAQSKIQPRDHPDKKEGLVVSGAVHDGKSRLWTAQIFRKPNVHLGEPHDIDGPIDARISHLLWHDHKGIDEEKLREAIRKIPNPPDPGPDPDDNECLMIAAGLLGAFAADESYGRFLDPNIRKALIRAAEILHEQTRDAVQQKAKDVLGREKK